MESKKFDDSILATIAMAKETLIKKGEGYSTDYDRLHNFRVAATLQGINIKQACGGMLAKHIASVFDMIGDGQLYSEAVWDEKIGDAINYLLILRAMVADESI